MTRFLLKPVTYLLVFGLLGCTSTKWSSMDQPVAQEAIPLIRVSLADGEQIELRDALVTDTSVSGMRGYQNAQSPGTHFTVQADQVQSIEIGNRKTDAGKTAWLVIIPVALILIGAAYGKSKAAGDWGN